jgi:glycosyltransferase involved in cell wall biosynthesis
MPPRNIQADSLYVCPWSLSDPLCRSQSLPYIRRLAQAGYQFTLMTFENNTLEQSPEELSRLRNELASQGIQWYPVRWNAGLALSQKMRSVVGAIVKGILVVRRHRPRLLHSRSSLPLPVSLMLTRLFGLRFLYDADSILSEEYVDVGYATPGSTGVRLLARSERLARMTADRMIVLTSALRSRLVDEEGVTAPIDVIPCCVDTSRFAARDGERSRHRASLGLEDDQILLVYVGKPGSWYLINETFAFYVAFRRLNPRAKLLIVTQTDPAVFAEAAENMGPEDRGYFIRSADPEEVSGWLSAADVGLSMIKQVPSKRGSSPVKFAEYLASGLPVVTTDGIGDCTPIIEQNNAGVVVKSVDVTGIQGGAERLSKLMANSRPEMMARCRGVAESLLSVDAVAAPAYKRIYQEMIGDPK